MLLKINKNVTFFQQVMIVHYSYEQKTLSSQIRPINCVVLDSTNEVDNTESLCSVEEV